jgi:hypothetical protein
MTKKLLAERKMESSKQQDQQPNIARVAKKYKAYIYIYIYIYIYSCIHNNDLPIMLGHEIVVSLNDVEHVDTPSRNRVHEAPRQPSSNNSRPLLSSTLFGSGSLHSLTRAAQSLRKEGKEQAPHESMGSISLIYSMTQVCT